MPSQPVEIRNLRRAAPTTLRWIGVGAPPAVEGIQSTTVDPDIDVASEGAPEWLVTNGLGCDQPTVRTEVLEAKACF